MSQVQQLANLLLTEGEIRQRSRRRKRLRLELLLLCLILTTTGGVMIHSPLRFLLLGVLLVSAGYVTYDLRSLAHIEAQEIEVISDATSQAYDPSRDDVIQKESGHQTFQGQLNSSNQWKETIQISLDNTVEGCKIGVDLQAADGRSNVEINTVIRGAERVFLERSTGWGFHFSIDKKELTQEPMIFVELTLPRMIRKPSIDYTLSVSFLG